MTTIDLGPYRTAVREKICSLCPDRKVGGGCSRPDHDPCALETHLDTVVGSILSVEPTDDIEPYIAALRLQTCSECRQAESGVCDLRDLVACSLDSYVLRVVEVVEEVARERGDGRFGSA